MKVKCQVCNVKDTEREEMEVEVVGTKTPQKKYFHKDCYQEHLENKAFKEKERIELDGLVEKIKEIYGVKVIPNNAYPYLQDLRNGTKFFGKNDYKYKEGYSYDLIAETFDYCSETIEYYNRKLKFNGFNNALRYGLAIVCDKLSIVEARRVDRARQEIQIEKHIEDMKNNENSFDTNYKKPTKHNNDITEFLDD